MKPPFKVPKGWEKGEPLTVNRVSETCYRLYRAISYLDMPGYGKMVSEVNFLEFESRVAMVEFQQWWDTPAADPRDHVVAYLTAQEFLEMLQEGGWTYAVHDIRPDLPDVAIVVEMQPEQRGMFMHYYDKFVEAVTPILAQQFGGDGDE